MLFAEALDRWRFAMRLYWPEDEVDAAIRAAVDRRKHDGGLRPLTSYLDEYRDLAKQGRRPFEIV